MVFAVSFSNPVLGKKKGTSRVMGGRGGTIYIVLGRRIVTGT